jgi:hypothetical protein
MADGIVSINAEGDQQKGGENLADVFKQAKQLARCRSEHPKAEDLTVIKLERFK